MQTTLHLELRPSRWLIAYILLAHGLGLGLVWAPSLAWPLTLTLSALVVLSLWHNLTLYGWRKHPRAVAAIRLHADFSVEAQVAGQWQSCVLAASSYVGTYLLILQLRSSAWYWPCTVIVLPDNLDADLFRRVRIWLRWGYAQQSKVVVADDFSLPATQKNESRMD